MERELWPRLYHRVMEVGQTLRLSDVTYQPHIIVLVWLWAALHDRPVNWACEEQNWATTRLRPATLPDPSTLSRRLRRVDTAMLMRAVVDRVRQEGDPQLVAVIDAQPLPVGGASEDPEARWGRGAGSDRSGCRARDPRRAGRPDHAGRPHREPARTDDHPQRRRPAAPRLVPARTRILRIGLQASMILCLFSATSAQIPSVGR
jgi:hypothetical protein